MVEFLGGRPGEPKVKRIEEALGMETVLWSALQFGELADVHRRDGLPVEPAVERVASIVEAVPVTRTLAVEGSKIKAEARRHRASRDFSLADGILLATARSRGQKLLTYAREFSVFPDAVVLARS